MNEGLIAAVRARIGAGLPLRRTLPDGGRLHVDRPLPFLCVYRRPLHDDAGTVDLVKAQAAYLVSPRVSAGDVSAADERLAALVSATCEALAAATGACLVLELWTAPVAATTVRIVTRSRRIAPVVDALRDGLASMPGTGLTVTLVDDAPAPPGRAPLISQSAEGGCDALGVELPAVWRAETAVYPLVLRALTDAFAHVLQRAFFELARITSPAPPAHFHMLGRRRLVAAARGADRALCESARAFDFLLEVTPVNGEELWDELARATTRAPRLPALRYRPLTVDPEIEKRRIYDLPLESVEDPVLARLFREKRREIDRQLTLLEDRGSASFMYGSLQLYGEVDDTLVSEAEEILATLPPVRSSGPCMDAPAFAVRAEAELEAYRKKLPALRSRVYLRDDVLALVVSHGDLLVPAKTSIPLERVEALVAHEVGTHVVTHANGLAQPLVVLSTGLAGYEALQEGLGLFAEHLVGGLDAGRLRLIAARVVAVRRMIEGVPFQAVLAELTGHGLTPRAAFGVVLRVFRGGGLTKDAIYLRGLLQLLEYLAAGGALEPLLVGKIGVEHVPLIEELLRRGVIDRPALEPRWTTSRGARERLERARVSLLRPLDLVDRSSAASAEGSA